MAQIAADELDVAMARIAIRSGDTALTPNEGYTAGSQSIQFGGVAMRQACADVRALFLDQAAKVLGCKASELVHSRRQHPAQRRADRPGLLDACRRGRISPPRRPAAARASRLPTCSTSARAAPASICRAKIFGEAAFIHDMQLDGMVHARVVRQPNRGATIDSVDETAIQRAAKGAGRIRAPRQFPRHRRQ